GEFVFFGKTLPLEQQTGFPPPKPGSGAGRCSDSRPANFRFPAIAMPGWNLDDRRDTALLCYSQRAQTIARPTVKQIVASGRQMPGCDPVEIFFLCGIIVRPIQERNETH